MAEQFKVVSTATDGHLEIPLRGRFTFADYSSFRKTVDDALGEKPKRLTIDMTGLEFIDSAALGMLLLARDEASKINAVVDIRNASGQVVRVLEVARFKTLFEFH
ncbi:MAG: STAS domain-containing protein [Pseudomonadota bacterium]